MPVVSSAGHINAVNVANVGLYLGNVLLMWLAYADELPGEGPVDVLFDKYPTLITPGKGCLAIFPVIGALQGIFVFCQMIPWGRDKEITKDITPWWFAVSILQIMWIVDLGRDFEGTMEYAMILCLIMLACLLGMILVVDSKKPTLMEWCCLRMPFSFHAGWLVIVSTVNVNVWAAQTTEPAFTTSGLFALAMISLSFIFLITALFGMNTRRPDPFFCLPVAWGMYYVWMHSLKPPNMPDEMTRSAELACQHIFSGVCIIGVFALGSRLLMQIGHNKFIKAYDQEGLDRAVKSQLV